jgi:hypothetical protein
MDEQVVVELTGWNLLQFPTMLAWIGRGVEMPFDGLVVVAAFIVVVLVGGDHPTTPTQTQ